MESEPKPPRRELVRIARARYFICMRIAKIERQRIDLITKLRKMRFVLIVASAGIATLYLLSLTDFLN